MADIRHGCDGRHSVSALHCPRIKILGAGPTWTKIARSYLAVNMCTVAIEWYQMLWCCLWCRMLGKAHEVPAPTGLPRVMESAVVEPGISYVP